MGWIRTKDNDHIGMVNATHIEVIDRNGTAIRYLAAGLAEPCWADLSRFETGREAEAEFDRIAAWLNDGAKGVFVVGEGPMGKADGRALYDKVEPMLEYIIGGASSGLVADKAREIADILWRDLAGKEAAQ